MEIKFDKLSLNQYTDDDFKANNFIVKLGEPKDLLNVETEYALFFISYPTTAYTSSLHMQ